MRLELETPLSAVYGGGTSCAEVTGLFAAHVYLEVPSLKDPC